MADVLGKLFGGKSSAKAAPTVDADFADFAKAADPTPAAGFSPARESATLGLNAPVQTGAPFTKWYRLDERHSIGEFKIEGLILAGLIILFAINYWGGRVNRNKTKQWLRAHYTTLASEFTQVGYEDATSNSDGAPTDEDLKKAILEKSLYQFDSYATGRQNVESLDVQIKLRRRFDVFSTVASTVLGLLTESFPAEDDNVKATVYTFDGRESKLVSQMPGSAELRKGDAKSTYDGFVWAIVNKSKMKLLREDRYDVSLTQTKDNAKLPSWVAVMSESAEVTNLLLTSELVKELEQAGDLFDYLLVTDQPRLNPDTVEETQVRKRIILQYRLPSNDSYSNFVPLLKSTIRLADTLVKEAHFRPEVTRKVKAVREAKIKEIEKLAEDTKSSERSLELEKVKKQKRDRELSALDAKGQKKYLEKEREREQKKQQKKMSTRR